jgi:hypothetical protein
VEIAVARARGLSEAGWHVHVVDADGRIFYPEEFDHLLAKTLDGLIPKKLDGVAAAGPRRS